MSIQDTTPPAYNPYFFDPKDVRSTSSSAPLIKQLAEIRRLAYIDCWLENSIEATIAPLRNAYQICLKDEPLKYKVASRILKQLGLDFTSSLEYMQYMLQTIAIQVPQIERKISTTGKTIESENTPSEKLQKLQRTYEREKKNLSNILNEEFNLYMRLLSTLMNLGRWEIARGVIDVYFSRNLNFVESHKVTGLIYFSSGYIHQNLGEADVAYDLYRKALENPVGCRSSDFLEIQSFLKSYQENALLNKQADSHNHCKDDVKKKEPFSPPRKKHKDDRSPLQNIRM